MTKWFGIEDTPLEGLRVAGRGRRGDGRGWFERAFCEEELGTVLEDRRIVQINRTLTEARGVIRGMHSQLPPHAELKVVSCLRGEVFDVAVDLRRGSPTFLQWHGEVLSETNGKSLIIPEGFAHGFQTLSQACEMFYLHTAAYAAGAEFGLNPCDPMIGIDWPLEISQMSDKDSGCARLSKSFEGVVL